MPNTYIMCQIKTVSRNNFIYLYYLYEEFYFPVIYEYLYIMTS